LLNLIKNTKNTIKKPRKHGFNFRPNNVKLKAKTNAKTSFKQYFEVPLRQQSNNLLNYLIFVKNTNKEPKIK
jgi:hypothetical protein